MKNKTCLLILIIFMSSCEKDQIDYLKENGKSILSVTTNTTEIDADGESELIINAKIPDKSDSSQVTFSTNNGTFSNGGQTIVINAVRKDNGYFATVNLKSSLKESGNVSIKVSVPRIDTILLVKFINAFADSIQVESSVASIQRGYGSEIPIVVKLLREKGIPSVNQHIQLGSIRDDNTPIGEFRAIDNFGSNDSGLIKATFVLKDTSYIGRIRIFSDYYSKSEIKSDTMTAYILK